MNTSSSQLSRLPMELVCQITEYMNPESLANFVRAYPPARSLLDNYEHSIVTQIAKRQFGRGPAKGYVPFDEELFDTENPGRRLTMIDHLFPETRADGTDLTLLYLLIEGGQATGMESCKREYLAGIKGLVRYVRYYQLARRRVKARAEKLKARVPRHIHSEMTIYLRQQFLQETIKGMSRAWLGLCQIFGGAWEAHITRPRMRCSTCATSDIHQRLDYTPMYVENMIAEMDFSVDDLRQTHISGPNDLYLDDDDDPMHSHFFMTPAIAVLNEYLSKELGER